MSLPAFIDYVDVTPAATGDYVTVDLSAHIDAGATGIALLVQNRDAGDQTFACRHPDDTTYAYDAWRRNIPIGGQTMYYVGVDASRQVDIYVSDVDVKVFLVYVFGSEAVFFDDATTRDISAAGYDAWEDCDISGETGTDTAIGAILQTWIGGTWKKVGYRKNGSTDDRSAILGWHGSPGGVIVGVDEGQVFEQYADDADCYTYLVGYIRSGWEFNTDATDLSTATTGSYVDLAQLPAGALGALIEVSSASTQSYGLRENGDDVDHYYDVQRMAWHLVQADADRYIEGKIEHAHVDFFLVGYPIAPGPAAGRTLVTLLDASGDVVAVLPAQVRWSLKLTRPDELVQVTIPWEYLLSDGTLLSKVEALDTGWYALFDGGKYVVGDVDTDNESGLTFDALSAETDDLGNLYTNYSGGPATYLNMLPTDIADAVLSGQVGRAVKNAGFGILDTSDLPTNWSHPAGWTSELVSNRRVWQADAGSEESYSDDLPCTPGVSYRVKVDIKAAAATGTVGVLIRWIKADGSTVDSSVTNLATEDGAFHEVDTGGVVALGTRLRIVLKTAGTASVSQFDDVRLYEIGPDSGYTYTGAMDSRPAAVPYTDGAIVRYGVWTEGASYLESTTAGDYVGRVVNGPFVTVCFAAGGAGAEAKVRINGVQYEASGTSLVPGTTAIDVSAAVDLTASGLDPANDHIVEVEVGAVKVRFEGLTVSTDNLISMKWDDKTLYEALWSIAKAVGGELVFDAAAGTVTHLAARGSDLKATNVVEFRRGLNVIRMTKRESRGKLVNRLTYIGYGEGQYMLRVTVDATSVNSDGNTSQDVYGVRRGIYINKECKSLATATAEAQRLVEESCWPQRSYDVQVTDEVADLLTPGDVGHFVYRNINEDLRILEITRTTDGGPASLVVARTSDPLVDQIVAAGKQLATLQKSYQGVPSDSNMYFSEQFDRFSDVDKAATIPFFVPYGADLEELWLTYEVGGMRTYAKGAASGGGSTSGSGGGSTPTSNAGGSSTPTSDSVSTPSGGGSTTPSGGGSTTPSGGGSTSGSTSPDEVTVPGTARSVDANTSNAWATVAVDDINATTYPTQVAMLAIFNRSAASRTFDVELAYSYGGSAVYSTSPTIADTGCLLRTYAITAGKPCFWRIRPGTTSSSSYDFGCVTRGTKSHDHSTPAHTHSTPDHTHSTPDHTHPAHTHTVTIGTHTHTVTIANHTHTTPDHTHDLTYGIRESSAPTSIRVYVDDTLVTDLNDVTLMSYVDLLPWVRKDSNGRVAEGRHTIAFKTATNGQTGSVRGTVYSKKFLATEAA